MDVIVVGGGCSGVVSAITAKEKNNNVIILERNDTLLKKLLLTGNGRCNYFNEVYNTSFYFSDDINLVDEFISSENIKMAKDFFDKLGIIPKIKNGYYYPYSNQAINIKNIFMDEVNRLGIDVKYNCYVENIKKKNNRFIVTCNDSKYECDKVILASGSFAYPKTGSDGSGYSILEELGHTIIKPVPALVQLKSNFKYMKDWDGVRSEVRLELFENNNYIAYEEGEVQLTKYGISGICTFNLSHFVSRGLLNNNKYSIKINFVPFIETLITPWMDNYSKKHKERTVLELLNGFLNQKISKIILKVCNIDYDKKYTELDNKDKFMICKNLRSFNIDIIDTLGFDSAQVCSGGVKLSEINISTMESKKVKGLYIIGELLDITGKCGGYNLTECWISSILAGRSVGGSND